MPAAAVKGTFNWEDDRDSFAYLEEACSLRVAIDLLMLHTKLSGVGAVYIISRLVS